MSIEAMRRHGSIVLHGRSTSVTTGRQRVSLETAEVGPQGRPGKDGASFTGHGYIQYYQATVAEPQSFTQDVRTPLQMEVDAARTVDSLQGRFAGHVFWDGMLVRPLESGDGYDLRLTLTATAAVSGGTAFLDVTIPGQAAPTATDDSRLFAGAGFDQTASFQLKVFPKTQFLTNGAGLFLTSTVPITVKNLVLVVEPLTAPP